MALSKSTTNLAANCLPRHQDSASHTAAFPYRVILRISTGIACLLLASGVFHFGVWSAFGGEWEGEVSWRKPILFGLSAGMTLASFSWLAHRVRSTAGTQLALLLLSTSLLLEVALITLQQWRGVPSHFNRATLLDRMVDQSMTGLILLATVSLLPLAIAIFRTAELPSDLRLAVRSGIVFLLLSCLIGVIIWLHGLQRLKLGLPPAQVGTAGGPKFPHGVSIHALQLFPITCWFLAKFNWPMSSRRLAIGYLVANQASLLLFSIYQTMNGRSRFDIDLTGLLLLIASVSCLLPMVSEFLRQWRHGSVKNQRLHSSLAE